MREAIGVVGDEVGHVEAIGATIAFVSRTEALHRRELISAIADHKDAEEAEHHSRKVAGLGVVGHADAHHVEGIERLRHEATERVS